MKRLMFVVTFVVLCCAMAFGQAKPDPTLDKLATAFVEAVNAKDAAKVASFYAEDGTLLPPDSPIIRGRANIEAYYKEQFSKAAGTYRRQPSESAISGQIAFEVGTTSRIVGNSNLSLLGVGGSSTVDASKYVIIYKRVQNDWKIGYHIFNRDAATNVAK